MTGSGIPVCDGHDVIVEHETLLSSTVGRIEQRQPRRFRQKGNCPA